VKDKKAEVEWLPVSGKHRWSKTAIERVKATALKPSFVAKKCELCDTIKFTYIESNRAWNSYSGGGPVCSRKKLTSP